jgi:hypothetical protein
VSDQIASCDTEAERETRSLLLHPFVPIVCIADEKETIRYDVQSVALCKKSLLLGVKRGGLSMYSTVSQSLDVLARQP